MTREEFTNFNPAEGSVLAEKARVDEAMRRHDARELRNDVRRGNIKLALLAIAFAVLAAAILWVG
jgi:hypothetical protein